MLDKFIDLTKPFAKSLEYPKEYNPRVHGPYNPARFYGKRNILFFSHLFLILLSKRFHF